MLVCAERTLNVKLHGDNAILLVSLKHLILGHFSRLLRYGVFSVISLC